MKSRSKFLAIGVLGAVALPAAAAPTVIQNGFVQAGVSDYGTLGSDSNTSPGILYDSTGTGNYGVNDFLTPGDPFEGFYVSGNTATGSSFLMGNNNDDSSVDFGTASPSSLTGTTASSANANGTLSVKNDYALSTLGGQSVIAITTTLTNVSGGDLSNVDFLRILDPDPDVNGYGSYFTQNAVFSIKSTNDEACGTGPDTGETICIFSGDATPHQAGVSEAWDTNPADYLSPNFLNDGNGDFSIGEAFSVGTLGAGDSTTLTYDYVLGASLSIAKGPPGGSTSVPEPTNLALWIAGLFGLGWATRRKFAKQS